MATISVQTVTDEGIDDPTFSSASAAGDEFINDERTLLVLKNSGTGTPTVTVAAQQSELRKKGVGTLNVSDLTIDMTSEGESYAFIPATLYNDGDGKVQLSYSDESNITLAALRLERP